VIAPSARTDAGSQVPGFRDICSLASGICT
jgi:hypothetical protein